MNTQLVPDPVQFVGSRPTDDEAAAALAAIAWFMEEAEATEEQDSAWQWIASRKLISEGLLASRVPVKPVWSQIERIRRAGRGGSGMTGF
jgi:hypothetical protein